MDGYGDPDQRSTLPGSLLLLAGLLGVINGVLLLLQRNQMARMLDDLGFESSGEIITYTAVVFLILALFPLMGGFLHLMGGKPGIVKLMAVFGMISMGPILISSILSLIALILLTKSGQPSVRRYPPAYGDRYGPVPPSSYGPPEYSMYDELYTRDPYYPQYPWGPLPYDEPTEPEERPRRPDPGSPARKPSMQRRPTTRKGPVRKIAKKRPVKKVVKKRPVTGTEGRPVDPPAKGPRSEK